MITRFEARGYRNLDTALELGRVNVLIGPNNSGKSNLLKAIRFIGDGVASRGGPDRSWGPVIRRHGGREMVSWDLERSAEWRSGQRLLRAWAPPPPR